MVFLDAYVGVLLITRHHIHVRFDQLIYKGPYFFGTSKSMTVLGL